MYTVWRGCSLTLPGYRYTAQEATFYLNGPDYVTWGSKAPETLKHIKDTMTLTDRRG